MKTATMAQPLPWGEGPINEEWEAGADPTIRGLVLEALRASERGDAAAEARAWTRAVRGFPAWMWAVNGIGARVQEVEIAARTQHVGERQLVEEKAQIPCSDPSCASEPHSLAECGRPSMQEAMGLSNEDLPWSNPAPPPLPDEPPPWEHGEPAGGVSLDPAAEIDLRADPGWADGAPWDHDGEAEGPVEPDEPDGEPAGMVGDAQPEARIENRCPACGAGSISMAVDRWAECPDCGNPRLLTRECGQRRWSEIDWARLLLERGGPGTLDGDPQECVLCPRPIGNGARVWRTAPPQQRAAHFAHAGCMEEELGPAISLARGGREVADNPDGHRCSLCGGEIHGAHIATEQFRAHSACVHDPAAGGPIREDDDRDPCEWNPGAEREARAGDPFHAAAALMVGAAGVRLCVPCSRLPEFKRKRKRIPIGGGE